MNSNCLLYTSLCGNLITFLFLGHGTGVVWHFNRREYLLNLCLNLVYIYIAYYDNTLLVRTIPFFIIIA